MPQPPGLFRVPWARPTVVSYTQGPACSISWTTVQPSFPEASTIRDYQRPAAMRDHQACSHLEQTGGFYAPAPACCVPWASPTVVSYTLPLACSIPWTTSLPAFPQASGHQEPPSKTSLSTISCLLCSLDKPSNSESCPIPCALHSWPTAQPPFPETCSHPQ